MCQHWSLQLGCELPSYPSAVRCHHTPGPCVKKGEILWAACSRGEESSCFLSVLATMCTILFFVVCLACSLSNMFGNMFGTGLSIRSSACNVFSLSKEVPSNWLFDIGQVHEYSSQTFSGVRLFGVRIVTPYTAASWCCIAERLLYIISDISLYQFQDHRRWCRPTL